MQRHYLEAAFTQPGVITPAHDLDLAPFYDEAMHVIEMEPHAQEWLGHFHTYKPDPFFHSVRVAAMFSQLLFRDPRLGRLFSSRTRILTGLYHDLGKLFLDDDLLRKKELTSQEWATIEGHVESSFYFAQEVHPDIAQIVARSHPYGEEFCVPNRSWDDAGSILRLCDAFDAIASDHEHSHGQPFDIVLDELLNAYPHEENNLEFLFDNYMPVTEEEPVIQIIPLSGLIPVLFPQYSFNEYSH